MNVAHDFLEGPCRGRVAFVFEDFFDVDGMIGSARLHDRRAHELDYLKTWLMHDFDPEFVRTVQPGDVLVGGHLFGHGHPHGHAMRAMRDLGVRVVVAESFFPSFEQNERYNGMVLLSCPGVSTQAQRGEAIEVDWRRARVSLPARGVCLPCVPLTPHQIGCIEAGGEPQWLRRQALGAAQ